jgi:propanediol dehydratase small subunit
MTSPNSLVEDMARAICEADGKTWFVGTHKLMTGANFTMEDYPLDPLNNHWRHKAEAALSVLKDRLTLDDRELVERLQMQAVTLRAHRREPVARMLERAADRIIVLSGGTHET